MIRVATTLLCALLLGSGAQAHGTADALSGTRWVWAYTLDATGRVTPSDPARYRIEFVGTGRALVRADCNDGSAPVDVMGSTLRFGAIATTKKGCGDRSADADFVAGLARATSYLADDRMLVLMLDGGAGMMVLRPSGR